MSFDAFSINESDYKFFQALPRDEKILFLYDLICEQSYGNGSSDEFYDSSRYTLATFDETVSTFKDKLRRLVSSTISDQVLVNILFINNYIVFNSESKGLLNDAIMDLMFDGYILWERQLTMSQLPVFHHQRYCKVYEIVGKEEKISLN